MSTSLQYLFAAFQEPIELSPTVSIMNWQDSAPGEFVASRDSRFHPMISFDHGFWADPLNHDLPPRANSRRLHIKNEGFNSPPSPPYLKHEDLQQHFQPSYLRFGEDMTATSFIDAGHGTAATVGAMMDTVEDAGGDPPSPPTSLEEANETTGRFSRTGERRRARLPEKPLTSSTRGRGRRPSRLTTVPLTSASASATMTMGTRASRTPSQSMSTLEQDLTSKSNYENIANGTTAELYSEEFASAVITKRMAHRVSEKARRDRLTCAIRDLQALLMRHRQRDGSVFESLEVAPEHLASKAEVVELSIRYINRLKALCDEAKTDSKHIDEGTKGDKVEE